MRYSSVSDAHTVFVSDHELEVHRAGSWEKEIGVMWERMKTYWSPRRLLPTLMLWHFAEESRALHQGAKHTSGPGMEKAERGPRGRECSCRASWCLVNGAGQQMTVSTIQKCLCSSTEDRNHIHLCSSLLLSKSHTKVPRWPALTRNIQERQSWEM